MILVACAVGKEVAFLKPVSGVELLVTGVGPIEAAASVSRALAQSRYTFVVNAGIAGAFEGCAEIGDGVVVSEEFMEIGLETGDSIALPDGATIVERSSSDFTVVDRLVESGFASKRGITVPRVTATSSTAGRLAAYGVQTESMEGFAVLRAAEIAGVRAVEVRGISNIVTDRERSRWNFAAGADGLESVLHSLLQLLTALDG